MGKDADKSHGRLLPLASARPSRLSCAFFYSLLPPPAPAADDRVDAGIKASSSRR